MTVTNSASASTGRLARNSVGMAHIVFFVVAAAAPLTAVVGATPPAFAFGNGAGVPGAFVLAGLLYLIFSVGFTTMGRHVGGAGAFYTYITQGIGKPAGVGGAFIALLTYSSVQIAIYALLGFSTQSMMAPFGIDLPWYVWALGFLALVHLAGQRNIAFSGTILGLCMVAEIVILLVLNIAILIAGGGPEGINFSSFEPSTVFSAGLGVTLVFVVGSFIGFEATAIFAEEVDRPEITIPRATYISIVLIAVFYAFSTWTIGLHFGPSKVQEAATALLGAFYFDAATNVLGAWSATTMNVLLVTSLFACVLSFHNTLNRYFFALGREGLAARALGKVHALHGSPYVAGILQSISAATVIVVFAIAGQDPFTVVFPYMSALTVIGILTVQAVVCIAVILYFRKNSHGHGLWQTLIAPALAFVGLVGALGLVISNLELLAGASNIVVDSFPLIVALVGLGGLVFAMRIKGSDPVRYAALGKVFEA
ncbi:APC family permease [Rhizobium lemnae]|uniref:APC family permease n=1 Tax=Rhizobium lemnae TaxID=1214924 RepID=A0ABV8EB91_9HYPH|nr:APC family permease [Rhizobium lemnae]MCJ8507124.1 APC family permease [Rhizobium lemnae]